MSRTTLLPPCCGVETEYAFGAIKHGGDKVDATRAYHQIERLAQKTLVHLPGNWRHGLYLTNGGLLYRDGMHLEFCTPECSDPADCVRHVEAGHLLMQRLLREWQKQNPSVKEAHFFRHNFDYRAHSSWACHVSFLTGIPRKSCRRLVPHLVSKIILGGSGGFHPSMNGEVLFCLAPRISTFTQVVGSDTIHDRALIGEKWNHHCNAGHWRMHLICFETVCSHLARFLDIGTTLLILRLMDAEVDPAPGLSLRRPLMALREIALDPTCRCKVAVDHGRGTKLTAPQIQRIYLEQVQAHLHETWMPVWATPLCALWAQTLDLIEQGAPESVADRLDWATKFVLFNSHANQHGVGSWRSCRDQLEELDMRFGQLGGYGGIFEQLDSSGLLAHRVPQINQDSIQQATTQPPAHTRAKLRSEGIQQVVRSRHLGTASWTTVRDSTEGCSMNLSDPFAQEAPWRKDESDDVDDDDIPF